MLVLCFGTSSHWVSAADRVGGENLFCRVVIRPRPRLHSHDMYFLEKKATFCLVGPWKADFAPKSCAQWPKNAGISAKKWPPRRLEGRFERAKVSGWASLNGCGQVRAGPSWALRWRRGQRSAAFRLQQQIIKIVLSDFLPGNIEKGPDSPFIFLVLQQIRKLAIGFFRGVVRI